MEGAASDAEFAGLLSSRRVPRGSQGTWCTRRVWGVAALGLAACCILGLTQVTRDDEVTPTAAEHVSRVWGLETIGLFGLHLQLPHFKFPFSQPAPAPVGPVYGMPPQQPQPGMPYDPAAQPAVAGVAPASPQAVAQVPSPQSYDCETGWHAKSNWADGWSNEQMDWCCQNQQRACREPRRMSFYMYRVQDENDYAAQNVNLGDLPGVMWYLHNEVLIGARRKFNISRILRFRVTVMTTPESYAKYQRQFADFTAFDSGQCTVPNCDAIFEQEGYVVGCQAQDATTGLSAYVSVSKSPCTPGVDCKEASWYSLPGPCASRPLDQKDDGCNVTQPGGMCQFDYGAAEDGGITAFQEAPVTGSKDCTYYAKWAGQVWLNELVGITVIDNQLGSPSAGQNVQYREYNKWVSAGNIEYDQGQDKGVCIDEMQDCSFWDGRNDQEKCTDRQNKITGMFDEKFPFYPPTASLGEAPPCNAL